MGYTWHGFAVPLPKIRYKFTNDIYSLSPNVHDMAFVVTSPKYSLRLTTRLRYKTLSWHGYSPRFCQTSRFENKKISKLIAWTYVVVMYHFVVRVQQENNKRVLRHVGIWDKSRYTWDNTWSVDSTRKCLQWSFKFKNVKSVLVYTCSKPTRKCWSSNSRWVVLDTSNQCKRIQSTLIHWSGVAEERVYMNSWEYNKWLQGHGSLWSVYASRIQDLQVHFR
jgi:hypothetical protein